MLPLPFEEEGTFLNFSDLLTGYRLSEALMRAHETGVFEAVSQEGCERGPRFAPGLAGNRSLVADSSVVCAD